MPRRVPGQDGSDCLDDQFALFIFIEQHGRSPLVRLSIFRLPGLAMGNLLMLGLGALLAASIYLIATSLQQVAGYGAGETGLAMLRASLGLVARRGAECGG